ncbi:hypothetical protein AWC38_SpisGene4270 [Stylophora pistillata]|uniref:Uncharacterized protein n=1 Tax=Stylophora pistillata TaxID=50429 RepID=A0A2B4SPF5_STYPI|nr:hypothetical protein AWC38_SpisGene4270 [Stylophora pistillata]
MVCTWKWFLVLFLILSLQMSLSFSWRRRRWIRPKCICNKKYQPRCKLMFKASNGKKHLVENKGCSSRCGYCYNGITCRHASTLGVWETWTCQK